MVMSALLARTGRHRQRYEAGFRLVSGCVPYRLKGVEDDIDQENRLEVLMLTSPNRDDLIFPKGGWEDDETVGDAACREAFEEAGVRGQLDEENPLGVWEFKSKSRQESCSPEGHCKGYMFAMEVTEELDYWPEKSNHARRWLSVNEAIELCRYEWMRDALRLCHLRVLIEARDKQGKGKRIVGGGHVGSVSDVAAHSSAQPISTCFMKPLVLLTLEVP